MTPPGQPGRLELAAALLALGIALGILIGRADPGPYCPQEDSCRADYAAGHWHILEVTP